MIKVSYQKSTRYKQLVITDLVVDGHAIGSETNMLSSRVCAGVSAILVGSKMCFDATHTQIVDKAGHFECHIGRFSDKNDYAVMVVIITQLMCVRDNYGSLFMDFEEATSAKESRRS